MSPNVIVTENNNVNYNIDPSNNIAIFVGEFEKGPINQPLFITDILQFKQIFGRSREWNYNQWYQVFNFLQYAKGLYVCRTSGAEQIEANVNGMFVNSPGEWGNIITAEIFKSSDYYDNSYLKSIFSEVDLYDDFLVIIKRADKIVEKFSLSDESKLGSFYLKNIVLEEGVFKFENGFTSKATDIDYENSYNLFSKEDYEIDIIIADEDHNMEAIKLAESRKDCVAFLGLPRKFIEMIDVNNSSLITEDGYIIFLGISEIKYLLKKFDYEFIEEYVNFLPKSSYAFFVIGFAVINDGFTNKNRIVNLIADVAGLKVKQSYKNPWAVGVGVEKGTVNYENMTLILKKEWSENLYKKGVNTFTKNTLMSQKLFIDRPNSINRLYQRNILNFIERAAEKLIRKHIFTLNDRNSRGNIATNLKILLEEIISMNGLEQAKVYVKPISEQSIDINITLKLPSVSEFIILKIQNVGTQIFADVIGG